MPHRKRSVRPCRNLACARPSRWLALALLCMTLETAGAVGDAEMLARLREGGLVIALIAARHGDARGPHRPPPGCAPGARLTASGWQDALAIGVGLRKQRVFVELAHAGPGCAARHTAYLVFGADRVRHDPGLAASCAADDASRQARRAVLASRLAERPPYARSNLAVVIDACNLRDLAQPDWPECAHRFRAGDTVLFDPARNAVALGCLDLETIRDWSRREE